MVLILEFFSVFHGCKPFPFFEKAAKIGVVVYAHPFTYGIDRLGGMCKILLRLFGSEEGNIFVYRCAVGHFKILVQMIFGNEKGFAYGIDAKLRGKIIFYIFDYFFTELVKLKAYGIGKKYTRQKSFKA